MTAGWLSPVASVSSTRRELSRRLRASGIDSADLDARLLLEIALGLDHTGLIRHDGRTLGAIEVATIEKLAARRLAGEPIARIAGVKEFWGLRLELGPATLVPRPETETVVVAALDAIDASGSRARPLRLADLGTGSGALLLALLSELPNATGVGTDVSLAALATARENAQRLGVAARTHFVACDFGAALGGPFDLLVSNPPYVASGDIAGLAPEVREHDPRLALDGGVKGLDPYPQVATDARRILNADGTLIVEVGAGQAAAVAALLSHGGIAAGRPEYDIAGHPRAVLGRLSDAGQPPQGRK